MSKPKKPSKPESSHVGIIDTKKIKPPGRYGSRLFEDKYNIYKLEEADQSVFVKFEIQEDDTTEADTERKNLRQNIFQYMKKLKPKFKQRGLTLICRMDYKDPEDAKSPKGFRVWAVKEKKE